MSADQTLLAWGLGGLAVLLVVAAFTLLRGAGGSRDLRVRVQTVSAGDAAGASHRVSGRATQSAGALRRRLGEWLRRSGKMYSEKDIDLLASVISAAGYEPRNLLPYILGAKLLFLIGTLAVVAAFGLMTHASLQRWTLLVACGLPIGIMVPESVLKLLRRSHAKALRAGVPDALDLLVVCTEAGLGLESAMETVAREMRASNPAISVAFQDFLDELRVLPDRREAFQNFGRRSGVEGIRRMSTVLAQTLQLGTPLGQALRSMAGELRRERMVRLEEKAVRLPGLLVFPLILCILPVLLITLVGPSLLSLMDMLRHTTRGMSGH